MHKTPIYLSSARLSICLKDELPVQLKAIVLKVTLLFSLTFLGIAIPNLQAQILKRVKNAVKNNVELRTDLATERVIDKALNKAEDAIKKTIQPKSAKTNTPESKPIPAQDEITPNKPNVAGAKSSIEMKASTNEIFITGNVTLTGSSINYEGYTSVQIKITGPKSYEYVYDVKMKDDGQFLAIWKAPEQTGTYNIKAISSDKKSDTTLTVEVVLMEEMNIMTDENIEETEKAKNIIENFVQTAMGSLSATQRNELESKKKKAIDNFDQMIKLFRSINDANKKMTSTLKGNGLPPTLSANLSLLNTNLKQHAADMKQANEEFKNHTATNNTICEYLVMINEACAVFSNLASLYSKTITGILKNIVMDKAPGMAVDGANSLGEASGKKIAENPLGVDITSKEATKLFSTAAFDAESLLSKLGAAGFAGDMLSYISEILLKTFCGLYSGEMTQNFEFTYRNNYGDVWWKYGGTLKGVVNLRYPKNSVGTGVIKMKGSIEGNATNLTFFADPKEAVADEMKSAYNFTKLIDLKDIKPLTIPFSSAAYDKVGFGAVARVGATPVSFYIPIDAEYNVQSQQIKIFINNALKDFSEMVYVRKVYILMGPLPLFRWDDFPIEKAQHIIRGSLKENNIYAVTGADAGAPQINGTIKRKVENKDYSINLSMTMNVKKN